MSNRTEFTCPACGYYLLAERDADGWVVWCGAGSCKSEVSNEGASGETLAEAFEALRDAIEEEPGAVVE